MPSTRRIEPSEFTNFIAYQFDEVGAVDENNYLFEVDDEWEQSLLTVIKCASVGKLLIGTKPLLKRSKYYQK